MFGNFLISDICVAPASFFFNLFENFNNVATPLFCVWCLSLFVWFGLELAVLNAHFFNTKHTYISSLNRNFTNLVKITAIFRSEKKIIFLNKYFNKNL